MDPTLYRAATSGNVRLLQQVAESNAQVLLSKAPHENTALHIAIKLGHVDFTKEILKLCGKLLSMKNSDGDTALHCAARAGHREVVEILVDYVEKERSFVWVLRMQNKEGDTALHEALRNRTEDIAFLMLRADPRLPFVVNNASESSFLVAAKEEMEQVVNEILSIDGSANSGEIQPAAISNNPELKVEEKRKLIRMQDNTGRTALHYAVWRNNAKIVSKILTTDSRHVPYITDNDGHSPLHVTATFGTRSSMLELLEHCPDTVEQLDQSGRNVLHIALINQQNNIVRQLLRMPHVGGLLKQLDNNKQGNTPPFHHLTSKEDMPSSPVVVGSGRGTDQLTSRNKDYQTALEFGSFARQTLALHPSTVIPNMDPKLYKAATSGDVGYLDQLANAKTNTQLLLLSKAPRQNTALHISARFGHTHFARKILQLCNQLLKMKNYNDDTALHYAARTGCAEIVEILLDFEFSTMAHDDVEGEGGSSSVRLLRMQNREGDTALHEVLRKRQEDTAIRMVRADPRLVFVVNNANESPFLLAVKEEMEEVVKQMLSIDPSSNISEEVQASASFRNNTSVDIVVPIISLPQLTEEERRELIRIQDNTGRTALHYAAWGNNANIVRMILKTDSCLAPYMVDNNGNSPLHVAVAFGLHCSVLELLEHCPDTVEQFDANGRNILHIALLNRSFGVIQQLLELPHIEGLLNGADQEENTPIYHASREDKCISLAADSKSELAAKRNEDSQVVFAHASVHRARTQVQSTSNAETLVKKPDTNEKRERHLQAIKDENQVFVVIASLIATVTFAAAFTLPGGYRSSDEPNPGTAILASEPAFKAFVLLDTLALSFSVFAIFSYIYTWEVSFSLEPDALEEYLTFGHALALISCFCMLSASSAGVFLAVGPDNKGLAIAVLAICNLPSAVVLPFHILVLLLFVFKYVFRLKRFQ